MIDTTSVAGDVLQLFIHIAHRHLGLSAKKVVFLLLFPKREKKINIDNISNVI